jgi:GTP-binding protein
MEPLPLVAIVGRPNVGKSALFNRITGLRRAIVTNEPGITRDRIYGRAEWMGRRFEVVDTGGVAGGEVEEIPTRIVEQAKIAIEQAAHLVLVVDGRAELTASDYELAQLLRRTGKPLALAVNKIDSVALLPRAEEFYQLGISRLIPISAEHGLGVDDLLEEVTARLPQSTERAEAGPRADEINVAIIGRPNVGKSTLLNRMAQAERAIVSEIPGTTRDAVDTLVEQNGVSYRLVDTAGIRRKGKTKLLAEKLSVIMARRHIRLCDVALLLIDSPEGVTTLDATIGGYAHEGGKSVIVLFNKWDQMPDRRAAVAEMLDDADRKLKFLDYAPRLFLSAKTGLGMAKVFPQIRAAMEARRKRVPTAELNRFLHSLDLKGGTSPAGRRPKIYYITQASASPPSFVLFTDKVRRLHFSYERFLVNQLRKQFGFEGTPILLKLRPKKQ